MKRVRFINIISVSGTKDEFQEILNSSVWKVIQKVEPKVNVNKNKIIMCNEQSNITNTEGQILEGDQYNYSDKEQKRNTCRS